MRRRTIPLVLGAIVLVGIAALIPSRPSRSTPEPSEARLRAYVRLLPIAFRPRIAAEERKLSALRPSPVPMALRVAGGESFEVVTRSETRGPDGTETTVGRNAYRAPAMNAGHFFDPEALRPNGRSDRIRLVVGAGTGDPDRSVAGRENSFLLAEGESTLIPKPELRHYGGRVPPEVLSQAGVAKTNGMSELSLDPPAPLELVALAPDEIPSKTKAEPGGYALLFDTATLWRATAPSGTLTANAVSGIGTYFPPSWGVGRVHVTGTERTYEVAALAHVYVLVGARWRYARSWILQGSGSAWFVSDERAFAQTQRGPTGGAPSFGVPDVLLASSIAPLR